MIAETLPIFWSFHEAVGLLLRLSSTDSWLYLNQLYQSYREDFWTCTALRLTCVSAADLHSFHRDFMITRCSNWGHCYEHCWHKTPHGKMWHATFVPHILMEDQVEIRKNQLHSEPTYFPHPTLCNFWLFMRFRVGLKGHWFASFRKNSTESNSQSLSHPKQVLPEVLPAMAVLLEQVCMCRRSVLQRWLGQVLYISFFLQIRHKFWEVFCRTFWFFHIYEDHFKWEVC